MFILYLLPRLRRGSIAFHSLCCLLIDRVYKVHYKSSSSLYFSCCLISRYFSISVSWIEIVVRTEFQTNLRVCVCVCVWTVGASVCILNLLFSSGLTALSTLKSEHVAMETGAPDSTTSPRSVRYTSDPLMHLCLIFLFDLYCNSHWICVSDHCSAEHLPEPTEHSSVCGWHK